MRNRIVGLMVIGIAALMAFIIYSFNAAMTDIVSTSCSHGPSCPMWGTIDFQTNVSLGIVVFVVFIGLYLIFFGSEERIITRVRTVRQQIEPRNITKENYRRIMDGLESGEKAVLGKIIEAKGTLFQSELVDATGLGKVKVTRVLDKLEGKGLVERKRRGMTNVVILKR